MAFGVFFFFALCAAYLAATSAPKMAPIKAVIGGHDTYNAVKFNGME